MRALTLALSLALRARSLCSPDWAPSHSVIGMSWTKLGRRPSPPRPHLLARSPGHATSLTVPDVITVQNTHEYVHPDYGTRMQMLDTPIPFVVTTDISALGMLHPRPN